MAHLILYYRISTVQACNKHRHTVGIGTLEKQTTQWQRIRFLGQRSWIESVISHIDPDALQDHCDYVENLTVERGNQKKSSRSLRIQIHNVAFKLKLQPPMVIAQL